eukprot:scaffold306_cov525-Prasinococcus_capsulatus_cf.AAC.39
MPRLRGAGRRSRRSGVFEPVSASRVHLTAAGAHRTRALVAVRRGCRSGGGGGGGGGGWRRRRGEGHMPSEQGGGRCSGGAATGNLDPRRPPAVRSAPARPRWRGAARAAAADCDAVGPAAAAAAAAHDDVPALRPTKRSGKAPRGAAPDKEGSRERMGLREDVVDPEIVWGGPSSESVSIFVSLPAPAFPVPPRAVMPRRLAGPGVGEGPYGLIGAASSGKI